MRGSTLILSASLLILGPAHVARGGAEVWSITQISGPNGGARPTVSGTRAAWQAGGTTIVLYDDGTLTEIGDTTGFPNVTPKVGTDFVAWEQGWDVYVYDGTETVQVTTDGESVLDYPPSVWDSDLVWQRGSFAAADVVTWNGRDVVPVLASSCIEGDPRTSHGNLLWRQLGGGNCGGNTGELHFRHGTTGVTTQVTDNDNLAEIHFSLSDDRVAWRPGNNPIIYTWDATSRMNTLLSTTPAFFGAPGLAGDRVVWTDWDGNDAEVMVHADGVTTALTDNAISEGSVTGSDELVIWLEPAGDDAYIMAWNGVTTVRVTPEPAAVGWLEIDGTTIVYSASSHIYMARLQVISADADGDGVVGVNDLITVIINWGPCPARPAECPGDLDGDGAVGIGDLELVILGWD